MAESLETVLYEKKDGVACITLNRPKVLNALNKSALSDMRVAFENARDDAEVRGVIFTVPAIRLSLPVPTLMRSLRTLLSKPSKRRAMGKQSWI